jgi:hypothetical protein
LRLIVATIKKGPRPRPFFVFFLDACRNSGGRPKSAFDAPVASAGMKRSTLWRIAADK